MLVSIRSDKKLVSHVAVDSFPRQIKRTKTKQQDFCSVAGDMWSSNTGYGSDLEPHVEKTRSDLKITDLLLRLS